MISQRPRSGSFGQTTMDDGNVPILSPIGHLPQQYQPHRAPSNSSELVPPHTPKVKKEHHTPAASSAHAALNPVHTVPWEQMNSTDSQTANLPREDDDDDGDHAEFADEDGDDTGHAPVFSTQSEEYSMQWDITAPANHPYAAAQSAAAVAISSTVPAGRTLQLCPVRGCGAKYVNRKSLHKHMLALHRGAKATKDLAALLPTTATGRKRKPKDPTIAVQTSPIKRSPSDMTPAAAAAKRQSPRQSKLSYAAASDPTGAPAASSPTGLIPGAIYPPSSRSFPPWALTASFPPQARDGAHPLLQELSRTMEKYFTTPLIHRDDQFTVDELFANYLLSLYSPSSGLDRLGFQRVLTRALWIRGGLERWARNWKRMAAEEAKKEQERKIARSGKHGKGTKDTPEDIAAERANEALARNSKPDEDDEATWWRLFTLSRRYPPSRLLERMSSFLSVTFEHGEGRSVPVREQQAKISLVKDMRSWVSKLPKQTGVRVERPQRQGSNLRSETQPAAASSSSLSSPTKKSASTPRESPSRSGSRSAAAASSSSAVAARSHSPDFDLSQSTGSTASADSENSDSDSDDSRSGPRPVAVPVRLPGELRAAVAAGFSPQLLPVAPARNGKSRNTPAVASSSHAAASNSVPPFTAASAGSNLLSWSKSSLEQLNSLLLSNDGKVDRNLTLRQIADTLGKSIESVREQVSQIRKLKEMEEGREHARIEQLKLEAQKEKFIQRAIIKQAKADADGTATASSSATSRKKKSTVAAAAASPQSHLLHIGDTTMLDSSLVPSIGNKRRKRKAKGAPVMDVPPFAQPPVVAPARAASSKKAAAAASSSKRRDDDAENESDDESDAPVTAPPAKKQRVRKTEQKAASAPPPAIAPATMSLAPSHHSPPPPHSHYAMMPYPGMQYSPYPYHPMMPPMPPPPAAAAVNGKSKKGRSKQNAPAASPPPAHPGYAPYPGYPPAHTYPSPGWGHPGSAGGYPHGMPPPPPVSANGQPMQWSWMLVPVPAPQAAQTPHNDMEDDE